MLSKVKLPLLLAGLIAGLVFPCSVRAQMVPLDSAKGLQPHDVTVEAVILPRPQSCPCDPGGRR